MSPTINQEDLVATLESHKDLASKNRESAGAGEANTIDYLVRPFIEDVLGYRFNSPTEIERESDVGAPGKNEKVDIALIVGGHRVVLVEVKRRGEELGHRNIAQLQNYFTWVRTARFAVLTDGIQWQWFKGKSGPGNENYMEDKPFLVHDALSPADKDIDWIWNVSKARFDAERLTALSRQIEFTAKLRDWILKTLVSPDAKGARQINEWVGLGASSQETPLVVGATRLAWEQVVDDQVVGPDLVNKSLDETPRAELPSVVESSLSEASTSVASATELRFMSRLDDQLDIGEGETLSRFKRQRAWKIHGQDWQIEKSGTQLTTALLALMLECDSLRDDTDALADQFGLQVFERPPQQWKWEVLPGFRNLYYNKDTTFEQKRYLLAHVADKLSFNPPAGHPLGRSGMIECWLPDLKP